MRIFIMLFWYYCLAYIGDAETQNNICVSYVYICSVKLAHDHKV